MLKRVVSVVIQISVLISASFVFAQNETRDVDNKDSWQEVFDINERKSGKWNVYAEAEDKGGNVHRDGPFNMYIDPDSDYPVSGITSPTEDMRVQGNLNIVGTCVDDDGVSEVWLVLDGAEPILASGKEFWSYYLDTTDFEEGPHTIEVWGVDINGLSSQEKPKKKALVTWNMDRQQPVITIENHEVGELVSGKVKFEGTVSDGNGIARLWYSTDNGETFHETKFSTKKKSTTSTFSLTLDTKELEDGASVLWFRAQDKMGSVGNYSYLYTIDNTSPDVASVYPTDEDVCNGVFYVIGYAKDGVGIQSLSWKFGRESGELEVIPGNPYWSAEVDSRNISKSQDFEITATDMAGNVITTKKSISLNQDADKPVITITSPNGETGVSGDALSVFVRGVITDDDGVASVEYSLDNAEPSSIEAQGAYCLEIPTDGGLSLGTHTVTVTPVDIYGVKGESAVATFQSTGGAPKFSNARINRDDFVQGVLVHPEVENEFSVSVSSDAGLSSVNYRVESGPSDVFLENALELKEGAKNAEVSIPLADAPWGLIQIVVDATDAEGRLTERLFLINIKDLTYIHADLLDGPLSSKIVEGNGDGDTLPLTLESVGGTEYSGGMNVEIPAGSDSTAVAVVRADSSESLTVNYTIEVDDSTGGQASQKGRAALVGDHYEIPLKNLPSGVAVLTVTASHGRDLSGSVSGTFCVVRPRPAAVSSWDEGVIWFPNGASRYDEASGVYMLPTTDTLGGYVNVNAAVNVSVSSPDLTITSNGKYFELSAPAGLYSGVTVTATDGNGVAYASPAITVFSGNGGPAINITSPVNHAGVSNSVSLSATVTDGSGLQKVEYSTDDGATWRELTGSNGEYTTTIGISSLSDGLVGIDVRATNSMGVTSMQSIAVHKDTVPPEVRVLVPGPDDLVNGRNLIAFAVKDAGRLESVSYIGAGGEYSEIENPGPFVLTYVGTEDRPLSEVMTFSFTDSAGNTSSIRQWDFMIDNDQDLPVTEIHVPEDNAVITRDFEFSGVIYDDDGVTKDENGVVTGGPSVYYQFDGGEFTHLDQIGTGFVIPELLNNFTDNEHTITMYAVDINGVRGPEVTRNFRISLEQPKGEVLAPPITETVRNMVTVSGNASDENGIKAVYVSFDNGNSYDEALGNFGHEEKTCNWTYEFDTHVIEDGTHPVFLRVVDWYDIEAIYSSIINIDNTPPDITLELPLDGAVTNGMVFFSGRAADNINLTELYISVHSLDEATVPEILARTNLSLDEVITQPIDLTTLRDGNYNMELTGTDAAGNITYITRNITLDKTAPSTKVDLLYPLNGEFVQGSFNIYGTAVSNYDIQSILLYVDGKRFAETNLSESGYFKFVIDQTMIEPGKHEIMAQASLVDGSTTDSLTQYLTYNAVGPWITIDNFTYGDFAVDRPFIRGSAGYSYDEQEVVAANAKGATKEQKQALAEKTVDKVEISFDNGRTFDRVSSSGKWRYRVENQDIAEGYHFLLVRVTMKNGETAVTRCIVQVDSTAPTVRLISPGTGGRYNQELTFRGLASDDVALKRVTLALRRGDRALYEVPAFLRGAYFDWQFWGATLFNVGAGLTFFDDNVKVQVQYGQFTQEQRNLFTQTNLRYGGHVIGIKLLANIYNLPFNIMFGHDFDWLSMNFVLGANFSWFSQTQAGSPQFLSAALVQVEFPRITFEKAKMFRTIAIYTEGQFWLIPTDVSSGGTNRSPIVPQISVGMRVNLF